MTDFTTYNVRTKILQELGRRCEWLMESEQGLSFQEAALYWARQSLDPRELPASVITPGLETSERGYGFDRLTLPITISLACIIADRDPLDFSEHLLAELRRKISSDDPTLGGLAQDIRYVSGGVEDYPEQDDQALVVVANFEIEYETEINNPDKGV